MATPEDREAHWDSAYRSRGAEGVSWFQVDSVMSLEMIWELRIDQTTAVIDVGGGASSLADRLLTEGFVDVSVLDLSDVALDEGRQRLGTKGCAAWLHEDVLRWRPSRRFGLWHDRAVFHFLTDEADRTSYLTTLAEALEPDAGLVIATFAEDGPEHCSGLSVARYSAQDLSDVLGTRFTVVAQRREIHRTPAGMVQPFTWVAGTWH